MLERQRREDLKKLLSAHPLLLQTIRLAYIFVSALRREAIAIIRYGPRLMADRLIADRYPLWQKELPVQSPSRVRIQELLLDPDSLEIWCRSKGLTSFRGGDATYLPPDTVERSALRHLLRFYPDCTGLKIAHTPGGWNGHYMSDRFGRSIAHRASHPHRLQMLLYNFLHLEGIAPRLIDLLEVEDAEGNVRAAYAVQHVEAEPTGEDDHCLMLDRLMRLEETELIELISAAGWRGIDFEQPDCNGNLLREKGTGRIFYVDVHNFNLRKYQKHLEALASSATRVSHFGGESRLLGGSYLYQEIPGIGLPAKRSPRLRMQVWDSLLAEAGCTLEGKIVFDIGSNLGLMGAEYLRRGASWYHGWDMPDVVDAAEKILLSIGCTRFSLTSGHLTSSSPLHNQVPARLSSVSEDDAVISYLAIRGHVGWLPALSALPWRWMLYEGHQDDGPLEDHMAELNQLVPMEVVAIARSSDGVSAPRDLALIRRRDK